MIIPQMKYCGKKDPQISLAHYFIGPIFKLVTNMLYCR